MTRGSERLVLAGVLAPVLFAKAGRRLANWSLEAGAPLEGDAAIVATGLLWTAVVLASALAASAVLRGLRPEGRVGARGVLVLIGAVALGGVAGELLTHGLGLTRHPVLEWPWLVISWSLTSIGVMVPYTVAYSVLGASRLAARPLRHGVALVSSLLGYVALVGLRHGLPFGSIALLVLVAGIAIWLGRRETGTGHPPHLP